LLTGGTEDADGIPLDQLEHALAIVRRRMDNPSKVDFLDQSNGDDSVPSLRKEVQQLRLSVLASQQESERLEEMLRVQKAICKDLSEDVRGGNGVVFFCCVGSVCDLRLLFAVEGRKCPCKRGCTNRSAQTSSV
jgi:hypothetical protein